jgi:hypothetical protein
MKKKKPSQLAIKPGTYMPRSVYDSTRPFKQVAPLEKFAGVKNNALPIRGTDLFSLFTANIIKENVVFTR